MSLNDLSTRAVLLLVDHQEGIAEMGRTAPAKSVDKAVAALASVSKLFGIPIVFSGIAMNGPPKLTHALRGVAGDDATIHVRQTTNSFDDAAIRSAIDSTGRSTILIAGIITEIAAQRAALGAKERGYEAQLVLDASNGASERSEKASVHRMVQTGVTVTSVPAIIGELAVDFSDPRALEAVGLLQHL